MKKKWKVIIGITLSIVVIGIVGKQCAKKPAKDISSLTTDQSYTVIKGDIDAKIEITGEIQPQTQVSLKSKVSGKIVKFYVEENDYVKTGQVVADIEPDYNQANILFNTKSTLQRSEISLKNARKEATDKKSLLQQNFISQKDYDDAVDALKNAEIEYKQAIDQYELIRELDTSAKVIHVYATSSGVVIERKINEGEMVQSSVSSYGEGTVLMKIADLNKMIVQSNINEVDIAKFTVGQKANISLDAYPYESFSGKIIKIAPMAVSENNAKVFPIEISLNAVGQKAKPGMTANVSLLGDARKDVLIIPIRAVFSDDKNQDIVYVLPKQAAKAVPTKSKSKTPVQDQGTATPIKLGANDLQMVEVISGLNEGDKISLSETKKSTSMQMMMH